MEPDTLIRGMTRDRTRQLPCRMVSNRDQRERAGTCGVQSKTRRRETKEEEGRYGPERRPLWAAAGGDAATRDGGWGHSVRLRVPLSPVHPGRGLGWRGNSPRLSLDSSRLRTERRFKNPSPNSSPRSTGARGDKCSDSRFHNRARHQ